MAYIDPRILFSGSGGCRIMYQVGNPNPSRMPVSNLFSIWDLGGILGRSWSDLAINPEPRRV